MKKSILNVLDSHLKMTMKNVFNTQKLIEKNELLFFLIVSKNWGQYVFKIPVKNW